MHMPARASTVAPIFLCALFACMPTAWSQTTPAFDCDKARSPVEHLICGTPDLASKDKVSSALYTQALADTPAVAKPTLRKAQREWLNRRNACSSADCVSKAYEDRLRELSTYTGRFDESYLRAMCGKLTSGADRGALSFESDFRLIGGDPSSLDVNNDGTPELLYACEGGTMRRPCTEYKDAAGNELLFQEMGFEWNTYATFGHAHFRYDGRTFSYHTYEEGGGGAAYVSYVSPLNREHVLCEFDNKIANRRRTGDAAVCHALERGEPLEEIALTALPPGNHYAFERFETDLKAFGRIDVDNDGKPEDLLELQLESGAGRGCDWNYFELAAPDGRALLKNEQSRLFNELQGLDEKSYWKRNCGRVYNRLLRHGGKIFYETNVNNADYSDHEARLLEGGRVETVCRFDRQIATTIRSINPAKPSGRSR
jgi:uncharacterized protein